MYGVHANMTGVFVDGKWYHISPYMAYMDPMGYSIIL